MVYVYDNQANAVLGFSTTSSEDAIPESALKGSATSIGGNSSFGVAFDGVGSLYTGSTNSDVNAIFPTGATGDVTPSGTLTNNTGYITGTSFDKMGDAFITATPLGFGNNQNAYSYVDVFAPGAMGSPTPIGKIAISEAQGANAGNTAVDSHGTLYVINHSAILIIPNAAGTPGTGAVIEGSNTMLQDPIALAIDSNGQLLVADAGFPGIIIFAKGQLAAVASGGTGDITPTAMITGSATDIGTPSGVTVDGSNNIWVADNGAVPEVLEFAAGSSGNAPPMAQITGSATMLEDPVDIVFVPGGDVTQSAKRRIPSIEAARHFRKELKLSHAPR